MNKLIFLVLFSLFFCSPKKKSDIELITSLLLNSRGSSNPEFLSMLKIEKVDSFNSFGYTGDCFDNFNSTNASTYFHAQGGTAYNTDIHKRNISTTNCSNLGFKESGLFVETLSGVSFLSYKCGWQSTACTSQSIKAAGFPNE